MVKFNRNGFLLSTRYSYKGSVTTGISGLNLSTTVSHMPMFNRCFDKQFCNLYFRSKGICTGWKRETSWLPELWGKWRCAL